MDRLKNKVALITGGAKGLGASIASHFFNEGANVILCDVNINDATKKAKELNGIAYYMDVSDSSNVTEIFKKVQSEYKQLDILVNNAGINGFEDREDLLTDRIKVNNLQSKEFAETGKIKSHFDVTVNMSDFDWFKMINTHLSGTFYCTREALKLRSEIIITEQKTQERLERRLTETIKEMKHMSKSNRRNIFDFLFEAEVEKGMQEAELEEAELSLELTDDEQETLAGAEDTEAVDAALEDILGDLEVSLETEVAPEEGGEEAADDGDEGDLALDAEEGGEEEELDLGEGSYAEGDLEEVYEIDENLLKKELAKMVRLREEADPEDADPAAQHGGEVLGDVILDIDEEDLINVLADEIGNTDVPATEAMVAVESRRRNRRGSARKLRETRKQNAEYKEAIAGLKSQLVEMNLFNAKLLYANKLMQNKNLTMKQQKAIVEALDNAKTLREAKLLFKSLSESLTRRSKGSKLNEGSLRTIGSSSRSTRSAQPASSGVEVDRWAVLAGLHGKN